MFKANNKLKNDYNRLLEKNLLSANLFLLHAELAIEKKQVETTEEELAVLLNVRFGVSPRMYS